MIRQVEEKGLGEVLHAPCDVLLSEENVVQPDILFVRTGTPEHHPRSQHSRRTRSRDRDPVARHAGKRISRSSGKSTPDSAVQEYWIVDPDAATVEVLTWKESGYITAGIYRESDSLSSPLLPGLVLPLAEVFSTH